MHLFIIQPFTIQDWRNVCLDSRCTGLPSTGFSKKYICFHHGVLVDVLSNLQIRSHAHQGFVWTW